MNKHIVNSQMQKCDERDSGSCYGSEPRNRYFVSKILIGSKSLSTSNFHEWRVFDIL